MRNVLTALLFLCLLAPSTGFSEDQDSVFVPPLPDTADLAPQENDTLIVPDTLTEAQKALQQFENKRKEYEEEKIERKPSLSLPDTISTYFLSQRLNQQVATEQSYYRDAGDYFHFDPSYFVLDYVSSPMRKTVQPFGLSGNRLNVISNRLPLQPFEHFIEPDGQMDLNDIPTAADADRFVVPGAVGMLLGGDQAVASLITYPVRPDSGTGKSAFLADQGAFEYNFVRGNYSRLFSSGREMDLSIGYRNADGDGSFRDDYVYHYTGRLHQPLGLDYGFNASGQLYSREGQYIVARYTPVGYLISPFTRDRIDRNAELSLERHNSEHDARYLLGYRYLRQGSHMVGTYRAAFDYSGWGLFASREWTSGSSLLGMEISTDHLSYNNGYDEFIRDRGDLSVRFVKHLSGVRYAFMAGAGYIDGFDLLPLAAVVMSIEKPKLYVLVSAAYTERAPSLHELHLRFQRASVYSISSQDYADQGNGELEKEKQSVASGLVELGSMDTNIRFSLTGGKIKNGIDWMNTRVVEPAGPGYTLFSPVNGDIDFFDASVQGKLRLKNFLHLRSGAAYHYIDYAADDDRAYLPDYQLFSGMELHVYWPQKIMDLYAYGELNYVSAYEGYSDPNLGEVVVANVKVSFRIKGFRMYYVVQNALSNQYYTRDGLINYGWYSFFGLVWNFID